MENKIMFIHIENGNFDGEEFLDVLSGIYRETEDSFEKDRGSISAFYKAVENKEKRCFAVNSLVLMGRFMSLGVLRDVFTDVAYHDLLCVNEARITMLYVETKYRNQGIATELLNNVKDIVKERSCGDRKFDCIEVLNFNYNTHMKNLLIKNGYKKIKEFGELKTLYKLELRGEKK